MFIQIACKVALLRSLLILAILGMASPAGAQIFTDNTFTTNWSTFVHAQAPPLPTVTAVAVPFPTTLPNRRRLTHNFFLGSTIFAIHLNSAQTYTPSSGAITNMQFRYTLQSVPGPNGTAIQGAYAPLVTQSGKYYALAAFDGANPAAQTYTHNMSAASFALIKADGSRDTTQHPDFSCQGAPITIGYYTGNSNGTVTPAPVAIVGVSDLSAWRVALTTEPCAPPTNSCCTPLTNAAVKDQLKLYQPGTVGTNYTFFIIPSAPYTAQFSAYINYLHMMNPAITTFTVTWTISDQGNNALPLSATQTAFASATNSWVCTTTGCPPPPTPVPFTGLPLIPNRWYRVTATASLNNGLTFWNLDCPPAIFDYNMREIP